MNGHISQNNISSPPSERIEETTVAQVHDVLLSMQQDVQNTSSDTCVPRTKIANNKEFVICNSNSSGTVTIFDRLTENGESRCFEDRSLVTASASSDQNKSVQDRRSVTVSISQNEKQIPENQSENEIVSLDSFSTDPLLSLLSTPSVQAKLSASENGSVIVPEAENYIQSTDAETEEINKTLKECTKVLHDTRITQSANDTDVLAGNEASRDSSSDLHSDKLYQENGGTSFVDSKYYFHNNNAVSNISKTKLSGITNQYPPYNSLLPEYLKVLLEGANVCGDSGCSIETKPEWFDEVKFNRGRWVAINHIFTLVFAEMISLLMILSFSGALAPLIFTGKSDSPFKAFKRYLSTVIRVRSWYLDDIWKPDTEGNKNIKAVRAMHEVVRQRMQTSKPDELARKSTISGHECPKANVWSPLHEIIREDFQSFCPVPHDNQLPPEDNNHVFINQLEMAMTQFGFVGLFILYPSRFGAHGISDEDLEAFLHLWRCIGYMLGMEDRYNFCNSDLETVRQRGRDIIHYWVKPRLRDVSHDWEHMNRCLVEGVSYYVPRNSFEVSLACLCDIIGIHAPRLWTVLTFSQKCTYYLISLVFGVIMRIPGGIQMMNWTVGKAIKCAQNLSSTRLRALEQRVYPYEENATCTRL